MRHQAEADLLPHYAENPDYFSPIGEEHTARDLAKVAAAPLMAPVLDLGCGDGRLGRTIPHLDCDGVDYCAERIAVAKTNRRGRYECADLYDWLEAPGRRYWTIFAVEVLEHLVDPVEVVRLARKRLAPGGHLIATVPLRDEYVAHLQVFADGEDVQARLDPDRLVVGEKRCVLTWRATPCQ